jgi:hypothetical protein
MGAHWTKVSSTNVGQSRSDGGTPILQPQTNSTGGFNSGLSRSEQRRFYVERAGTGHHGDDAGGGLTPNRAAEPHGSAVYSHEP